MTVLSDTSIRARFEDGSLGITPLADGAIQPASVDVRLGSSLLVFEGVLIDPTRDSTRWWREVRKDEGAWTLKPGLLYLGATLELLYVPPDLLCHLHGRSSLGRLGIVIHQTSGLIDPGYTGHPTLELSVLVPVLLRPGQPIGQLTFELLDQRATDVYNGRYLGDLEPTPSRFWQGAS